MLSAKERKTLSKYLKLAPYPEATLIYEELCGFLFGLAITPEPIATLEWLAVVYDDAPPDYQTKEAEGLVEAFTAVYDRLVAEFAADRLRFPFDMENLREDEIDTVYNWVAGLDEAMALRDPLWEPEEYPRMVRRKKEALYNALMTIEGLVDPGEGLNMFADMTDRDFTEAFPDFADSSLDREEQVQWLLLSTLPLAVDTLIDHAREVARKKAKKGSSAPIRLPLAKKSGSDAPPCSCPGGSCTPAAKKKAKIIKVDFSRGGRQVEEATELYQFKIALVGSRPPIWRRVQVPDNFTLDRFHDVIQLTMGWTDYHFHEFVIDHHTYCPPDEDREMDEFFDHDERRYVLRDLRSELAEDCRYVYDYSDEWVHIITLEKTLPLTGGEVWPVLLAGKRACPPEDIGGISAFQAIIDILGKPAHKKYREYEERYRGYDPARFAKEEMAEINLRLQELQPTARR
jgi:yecA family protein